MKLEQMTKEELLAAREIHEKTGATLKVAKIDKMLAFNLQTKPSWHSSPINVGDKIEYNGVITEVTEDNQASSTIVIDASPIAEAYKLKADTTMSWKEIGDRVGLKAQGLYAKVKKYAKENELPYA